MKENIYLDSDVILDFLYARDPHYTETVRLFSLMETGRYTAYISSLSLWNIYFILTKYTNEKTARGLIKDFRNLVKIVSIDDSIIDQAINSEIKDFENSIQYYAAKSKRIKYIISRTEKDYPEKDILALGPQDFLNLMDGNKKDSH